MARTLTPAERHEDPVRTSPGLFGSGSHAGLVDVVGMGVVGGVGGILLGAVQEFATASHILAGEYYWSSVLAGNALVLGFGWALLALRHLDAPGWVKGSALAGLLAFLAALVGGVVTKLGAEIKFSFLVAAALLALLAGLWLVRSVGRASSNQLRVYLLAGIVWLVLGALLAMMLAGQPTPNKVSLPGSIPLWVGEIIWWLDVPLVLTAPLLAAAFIRSRPGWRDLLVPTAAFLILPLALAACFAVTVHLIPD